MKEGWAVFRKWWESLHPLSATRRLEAMAILQPLAEIQVGCLHPSKNYEQLSLHIIESHRNTETFNQPHLWGLEVHSIPEALN